MADLEDLGLIYGQGTILASPRNLDRYEVVPVIYPSVSTSWFGTVNGGTASNALTALTVTNALTDYPRNAFYTIIGVSGGTFGGTFKTNWLDQFGSQVQETVVVAAAAPAVGVYGTAIVAKFISGSFISSGASGGSAGTAQIGYGTATNGSAQSNWFGLLNKVGGTADLKWIKYNANGTPTTVNAGTNIGSLINTGNHGFQGTKGVAVTDQYFAYIKPTYDARSKPKSAGL